jgi:hypothetical protein
MHLPQRAIAALIHLSGSVCLAILAIVLVFSIWCPGPLAAAVGVSGVLGVMLGVDVVLGPVMTAIVYKPGKRGLMLDLLIIIIIQLAAFAYGIWAIGVARPAWVVFSGYRFDLVQANDLDARFLADTPEKYKSPSWFGPKWVAAQIPADIRKRNQLMFESFGGGIDMPQRPDLYVPLELERERLTSKSASLSVLAKFNDMVRVEQLRKEWPDADGYFPMLAKSRNMTVLVNRGQARVVAVVDLKPF